MTVCSGQVSTVGLRRGPRAYARLAPFAVLAALALLVAPSLAADAPELDPALRELLALPVPSPGRPGPLAASSAAEAISALPRAAAALVDGALPETVALFVEAEPGWRPDTAHGSVVAFGDDLYAARVPLDDVRAWLASGGLTAARLSRPVRPLLDRSAAFIGMGSVRSLTPDGVYRGNLGRGVVIGIVDSGVDVTHPDFRDTEGRTRVHRYWDQVVRDGQPPRGYSFGHEWTRAAIDGGGQPGSDFTGHGTHVAGIAAGNGRGSPSPEGEGHYAGIAPEATLIVVRSDFSEYGVALAVHYVFARARELGLPAVVNLSLGHQNGPHDGSTPFERALTALSGPGRVIVVAAGNDGARDEHAEVGMAPGETHDLRFDFPEYRLFNADFTFVDIEAWHAFGARLTFTVIDPAGREIGSLDAGGYEQRFRSPSGQAHLWTGTQYGKGFLLAEFGAPDPSVSEERAVGTWTIRVRSRDDVPHEVDARLVGWSVGRNEVPRFLSHVDRGETIAVPATAHEVLAVGSVTTRNCWPGEDGRTRCFAEAKPEGEVTSFSSQGPTADGREKPDLLAPGQSVVSAFASTVSPAVVDSTDLDDLRVPGGRYWALQGTSMAAPHATGAVALLLARFPELTPAQAAVRLQARGRPLVDARNGRTYSVLEIGAALKPATRLLYSSVTADDRSLVIEWAVEKELGPLEYAVFKGFGDEGPFYELSRSRVLGENPFRFVDGDPEPGRTHVYRIAAVDPSGLIDDLDTLRVDVPGRPEALFRRIDPNPAASLANVRFFLPPSPGGARYEISVFDVRGRRVRRLAGGDTSSGGEERTVAWDLLGDDGRRVGAGAYWVRLEFSLLGDSSDPGPSGPRRSEVRPLIVLR